MATHSSVLAWRTSQGQRSLAGYSPQDHKESDTTEATMHAHRHSAFRIVSFGSSCCFTLALRFLFCLSYQLHQSDWQVRLQHSLPECFSCLDVYWTQLGNFKSFPCLGDIAMDFGLIGPGRWHLSEFLQVILMCSQRATEFQAVKFMALLDPWALGL